jgi:hypothetical protein
MVNTDTREAKPWVTRSHVLRQRSWLLSGRTPHVLSRLDPKELIRMTTLFES